ncbi:hypothetical protein TRVA0_001S07426 [Trichomonascus vanleenenianus]|uniref:CCDC12/cwf18 family protein n=1 Tax=Trichomonascus vanleenenianus TaxID=2268995 RepID=UPI003EC9835F
MSSLEQQAASRKERLAQLRGLKRRSEQDATPATSNDKESSVSLKSRNFDPETRSAKLGFDEPPVLRQGDNETVEVVAEELQQQALDKLVQQTSANTKLRLEDLKPKSAAWDLKRDLESKLAVLEGRTDNEIARLVRLKVLEARNRAGDED